MKMVKIIENVDYETDGHTVKQLIGNHLTVVIRNKSPVKPEQLIAFYKMLLSVLL